jgi:polyphosphate kinase
MAAPKLKSVPQLGMDEQQIEDDDLIEALEVREKRRNSLSAVRLEYDEANEKAQALLAKHELADGDVVRAGPYRIERVFTPAGHRSFDTKASSRIRIDRVDEG